MFIGHLIYLLQILGACILLGVGVATLTQATQGAGLIAAACFGLILARIIQSGLYQGELLRELQSRRTVHETEAARSYESQADVEAEVARLQRQRGAP